MEAAEFPWPGVRPPAAPAGLIGRGAFHPRPDDDVPALPGGVPVGTLVLLGFAGRTGWARFAMSPEATDGLPEPLDRWSRRVVGGLAEAVGGMALFPFGGPPWLPFQRWARRAEPVFPSPLGLLIHPVWGLWHSYRGAVSLPERLELPSLPAAEHPCDSCEGRPCLTACPVGAFAADNYDVAACAGHLAVPAGAGCMDHGCAARRACPVGADHRYPADAAGFYMRAFRAARR
jgi:hypothetical protein